MLDKIKALPEKVAFAIGLTLILLCPILSALTGSKTPTSRL